MAMTTIKATCPTCGEVELTADDLTLMVCSQAPLSYYAFRCPRCIEEIRKPADDHIISLLVSGGVRATNWSIPAEALESHDGYVDQLRRTARLRARDRAHRLPGRAGRARLPRLIDWPPGPNFPDHAAHDLVGGVI